MHGEDDQQRTVRIDGLVAEYVARYHDANAPRAEDLVDAHPDIAEDLAASLASAEAFLEASSVPDVAVETCPGAGSPDGVAIEGYEIVGEVHRGGQGVVYRAEQISTRRTVAIKVLLGGPLAPSSARRRFEREIDLVSRLRHHGIVTIHDSGTTSDGCAFYVMEFVEGETLDEHLRHHHHALDDGLALFTAICDAVIHAHRNGVIHRDLKPSNIIVDKDGAPKVLDFGLARPVYAAGAPEVSVAGQLVGTFAYMAPEQARGELDRIDIRTDVYALGVILYEILAGVTPYPVDGELDEILRHITRTVPDPPSRAWARSQGAAATATGRSSERCPIDNDLDTIVLKSIAKEPDRRFQSVAMLVDDLSRYHEGRPIESKRDSHLYVLRKTLGRNRGPVAVALLVVGLIVGFAVMMTVLYARADFERHRAETALEREDLQRRLAIERAEALRETAYFGTIALAQNALENRNTFQLRRLLDECPPDLRGWEWRYLSRLSDSSRRALSGHERYGAGPASNVRVAVSPDGRLLASGGLDRNVVVWEAASGAKRHTLAGHEHFVMELAFSPDGRFVASASYDGEVRIWSTERGETVHRLDGRGGFVRSVAWSPDGLRVASAYEDGAIRLWNPATGALEARLDGHEAPVAQVIWSPDGSRLLSAGWDGTVRVWNATTGAPEQVLEGHVEPVWYVAHDPTRPRVASAGVDRKIRMWDLTTGRELWSVDTTPFQIMSLSFSPDGARLAGGGGLAIRLWESETGEVRSTQLGHQEGVVNVKWAPDGKTLYSGGADTTVRDWDPDFAEPAVLTGHTGMVRDAVVSRDGATIATVSRDGRVRMWDGHSLELKADLAGDGEPLEAIALGAGDLLAAGGYGHVITLYDVDRAVRIGALAGHSNIVAALAFAPDGAGLVSGGLDGTVRDWDITGGVERRRLAERESSVLRLSFSAAGDRLVAAWSDGTVTLRAWPSGSIVHEWKIPEGSVNDVAFSHDGVLIAAAGSDRLIRLWNTTSGAIAGTLRGHNSVVQTLAFLPDDSRIISGGFDNLIMIWDHVSGRCALTLHGHGAGIPQIAIAPDGSHFVSVSNDHTARVWTAAREDD